MENVFKTLSTADLLFYVDSRMLTDVNNKTQIDADFVEPWTECCFHHKCRIVEIQLLSDLSPSSVNIDKDGQKLQVYIVIIGQLNGSNKLVSQRWRFPVIYAYSETTCGVTPVLLLLLLQFWRNNKVKHSMESFFPSYWLSGDYSFLFLSEKHVDLAAII